MHKFLTLFLVLGISILGLFAQQDTVEFEFDDGSKKKFYFSYDDPGMLPKWYAGAHIGFGGASYVNVIANLEGGYRFSDLMWADLRYMFHIAGGGDFNEHEDSYYKPINELSAMFHYALITGHTNKTKRTPIDYTYDSDGLNDRTTVYTVELPRRLRHQLLVDAGLSRLSVPSNTGDLEPSDPTEANSFVYYLTTSTTTNLNVGFSYYRTNSYSFLTNGIKRSYFGTRRVYAYAQYAIADNATFIKTDYRNTSNLVSEEVLDGFPTPGFRSFGWRAGYEGSRGMMNTGSALSMGVEAGSIPGYTGPEDAGLPTTYISLKFGVHFGIM